MRVGLALVAVVCLAGLVPREDAAPSPSIVTLIERYADGHADDAVREAAAIDDLGALRRQYVQDAQAWINLEPALASHRRAAAAAFLLELAHARVESDWGRFSDLVEFTCVALRTAPAPDAFELAWDHASIALASRARARVWLIGPYARLPHQPPRRTTSSSAAKVPTPRHLVHALERYPDDPQLRLARVVAWTWGRDDEPIRNTRWRSRFDDDEWPQRETIVALQPLVDDPVVGAEALVRIGHVYVTMNQREEALAAFERAQGRDAATAIRYLAFFSAGRALEALDRPEEAMARYARALEIVPGAESATLALATLQFVRDDRDAAVSRLDAIFNRPSAGTDPGRLIGYGSFIHWPELRDAMRAALPPARR
jgi:tetratricopeptide (TPR) repeat protein